MLIVLWKLLELVLLVREASVHTKVPTNRHRGERTKTYININTE